MMAVDFRYIGSIADSGYDQLVAPLRESLQYETAVVSANCSFGGAVEKYADPCQGFAVGRVFYHPCEYVVLRGGHVTGQTAPQRYKEGENLFHLILAAGKADPAKDKGY